MIALRLAAAAALLLGLGWIATNADAFERLDARLLVAGLAAQPPLALAQALVAWRLTLAAGRPEATFRAAMAASLLAQASDLLLPWRLSEFVRVVHLRDRARLPLSAGLAAAFLERIADLVVVAGLALTVAALFVVDAGIAVFVAVAALGLGGLLALPYAAPLVGALLRRVPIALVRRQGEALFAQLVARLEDGVLWRILVPTLAVWALAISATWAFIALAEPQAGAQVLPATASLVLTLFVVTTVGNVVAVLPASIGTYEAGVVIVLGAHGVAFEEALTIGIALHLAQLAIGVVGGAVVAAFSPIRLRDLIRDARAAAR